MEQEQPEHTDEEMDTLSELKSREDYSVDARRVRSRNSNSLLKGISPMLPGHSGSNPKARALLLGEHDGESMATAQNQQSGGNTKQNEETITDGHTTPSPRSGKPKSVYHNENSDAIPFLYAPDLGGGFPRFLEIPLSDDIFTPPIVTVPYSTVTSANFETRSQIEGESRLKPKRKISKDLLHCRSLSGLRSIAISHGKGTHTDRAESITSHTAASTTTLPATKPTKWFKRFFYPRRKPESQS